MLEQSGFDDIVVVDQIPTTMHYDSVDDYFEMQTAIGGPFAAIVAACSPEESSAIKTTLAALAETFEQDGAYDLPCLAVAVSAQ